MGVFAHWPNRITAIRFVGAFALFGIFVAIGHRTPADVHEVRGIVNFSFWLFVTIAATDFLDGYLARKNQHITAFGRIADPFTDKVLILGTMIFLATMPWTNPRLPAWIVVAILAREFLVTGIRGFVESEGREFPADKWGKIKFIVQCHAVGALIWLESWPWGPAWYDFWSGLTHVLVWTMLVSTVGSGASYVLKTREILTREPE